MTFSHALSTNNYGVASIIVDANAANGTHVTIQAAITAAVAPATIFIRPGTYTENLTLKAGVNLTAFGSDSSLNGTGKVIISGKATMTTAGSVTIAGIQLQTNSDFLLAVTGSASSIVNLNNCFLNCTNNTGISYTSSDANSAVNCYYCSGDLGTTGIGLHASSAAGILSFYYCAITNSGSSLTASTSSVAEVSYKWCEFAHAISCSSTAHFTIRWCRAAPGALNTTAITTAGTGTTTVNLSNLNAGSASAISIGTGSTVEVQNSIINSSNTNVLTGAGTLIYAFISFYGSSSGHNVTTETALATLI